MKQPTCEERIAVQYKGREEDFQAFKTLLAGASRPLGGAQEQQEKAAGVLGIDAEDRTEDELQEDATERLHEYPLAVEKLTVWKVDISTGGPADWLEAFTDSGGDLTRIVYHFSDWFDHAERTLEGDEFEAAAFFLRSLIPDLDA